MDTRTLGRSGITVNPLGMGCWAIGGLLWRDGKASGWAGADDGESLRALDRALALGANFFDTADIYGAGHSERLLGKALKGKRDQVVIATKFGILFNEEKREFRGMCAEADYIRAACDRSLNRLDTDYIDLYQFHLNDYDVEKAPEVLGVLEELVEAGKIRWFGWSTDYADRAALFAESPRCTAIQMHLNVFGGNFETLALCESENLASINRGPLAMGLLTGKFHRDTRIPDNDVRSSFNFKEGPLARQLDQLQALRDILTSRGRTLAQGALAWLWARSAKTVPIPGFKTVAQVEENLGALEHGPLTPEQMDEIDGILSQPA